MRILYVLYLMASFSHVLLALILSFLREGSRSRWGGGLGPAGILK